MRRFRRIALLVLLMPALFLAAMPGWRVDFFQVFDQKGNLVFSSPSALGHKFSTRYIHSVELTPVEDDYIVVSGRLWSWEERVRSSKAGMPSMVPEQGRFLETSQWMIYQGGRISWKEYYYRVGNKQLGLNQFSFEPFGRKNAYVIFPGQRLSIKVKKEPFMFDGVYRAEALHNAPSGVPAIIKGDRN